MSSRISKYQASILKFIKTKSVFSKMIKDNPIIETIAADVDHIAPIILLTITNNQYKKKSMKTYHGYYMASGIFMLMMIVQIADNRKYYDNKFGKTAIDSIINEMPFYVFKCLSQNIETLECTVEVDKILAIYHKSTDYLYKKVIQIVQPTVLTGTILSKRTDIIKYKFTNKNLLDEKYKKLKRVDKDKLISYVDQKYGSIGQCSFVIGWLLGFGDEKILSSLERLGSHLGLLIKLAKDFKNIEKDIDTAVGISSNFIVNHGIHECFSMFSDSKVKLIEGCMTLEIFTVTIKEIIDYLEKKFEECLSNTDLELKSMYSSFSRNSESVNNSESE